MTPTDPGYAAYVARHERPGDAADLALARLHIERLPARPRIDVVMPVHDPPEAFLGAAIESALGQIYPDLTLCLHDDASREPHVARVLAAAAARDPRVRISRSERNEGIARATNRALALGDGDFVLFLDHDDLLAPHALLVHADAVARHPGAAIVHSDGDLLDGEGRRTSPIWKPRYDPALLRGFNLVWGLFRRSLLEGLAGMREGFPGAEDHELSLRAAEAAGAAGIVHAPHVLYHWRMVPSSYSHRHFERCLASSRRAVTEHCARIGLAADVDGAPGAPGFTRAIPRYTPPGGVLVVRDAPEEATPARRDALLRSTTATLVAFVDGRLGAPPGSLEELLAAPFGEADVVAASPGIDSGDGAIEQRGLLLGVREVASGPPVARALRGLPASARAGL
ncbi:MAG: glycosyltransferase, partial [Deltaproteobacteria bacterium]|nr:glycosyltransferase [Deltaproteobacteria bacterium]